MFMERELKTPSALQWGEKCNVIFFGQELKGVAEGKVTKICFTASKVLYDVEIKFRLSDSDEYQTTRLHSIDAAFVHPIPDVCM